MLLWFAFAPDLDKKTRRNNKTKVKWEDLAEFTTKRSLLIQALGGYPPLPTTIIKFVLFSVQFKALIVHYKYS